jgi:hypothetical protein
MHPEDNFEALLNKATSTLKVRAYLPHLQAAGCLHVKGSSQGGRALTEYLRNLPEFMVLTDVTLTHTPHPPQHLPLLHVKTSQLLALELLENP